MPSRRRLVAAVLVVLSSAVVAGCGAEHAAQPTHVAVVAPPVPSAKPAVAVPRVQARRSRARYHGLGAGAAARVVSDKFGPALKSESATVAAVLHRRGGVARYLDDHTAVTRRGRGVVVSTTPLRHRLDSGAVAAVDTGLRRRGSEYVTRSAPVTSSAAATLPGGFRVGSAPRVTIAGQSAVARRIGGDRLLYPNTAQDTDVVAAPTSQGLEVFTVLRSAYSPSTQRWNVALPTGGALRAQASGGVAVLDADGNPVASVSAPRAFDAVGHPVPSRLEPRQGGTVELVTDHHRSDVVYPVLVDPLIQPWVDANGNGWWYAGHSEGLSGWTESQDDPHGSYWAIRNTCYAPVSCYGSGQYGLYIYAMSGTTYGWGSSARWTYTLPASRTTFFRSVEFKNMIFDKGADTVATPYVAAGIQGAAGWNGVYTSTTGFGNKNVKVTATTGDLSTGKKAIVGLWNTLDRPTPNWEQLYVGGVVFELDDPENPTLGSITGGTGGTAQTQWVRGTVAVQANATDPGLGVQQFMINTPKKAGGQAQQNYSVGGCTGRVESPCPTTASQSLSIDTTAMPDGVDAVGASVADAGNRIAPWQGWNLKVDNTAPTVGLVGTIAGSDGADVMPNGATQGLRVDAADPASGVKSITVTFDGVDESQQQTCAAPQDHCSLSYTLYRQTADLRAGQHAVRIDVVDQAGNHTIKNITFYVYRTSWTYGGDNHTIDTDAEAAAAKAAIAAATPQAAKDELLAGLTPHDRRLVERLDDHTAPEIYEIDRPGTYIRDRARGVSFGANDTAAPGEKSSGIRDLRIVDVTAPQWSPVVSTMLHPGCATATEDCPFGAHVVGAIGAMPNGVNVVQVEATDGAGNFAVKQYNVLVDSGTPSASAAGALWDQRGGPMTDASVALTADDPDSGASSEALYEVAPDGTLRFLTGTDRPCTVRCDPTRLGPYLTTIDPIALGWDTGPHTLRLSAWDLVGNQQDVQWTVNFYKTSWVYGGSDRSVNTDAEAQALVAALSANDGANATALLDGLSPAENAWIKNTYLLPALAGGASPSGPDEPASAATDPADATIAATDLPCQKEQNFRLGQYTRAGDEPLVQLRWDVKYCWSTDGKIHHVKTIFQGAAIGGGWRKVGAMQVGGGWEGDHAAYRRILTQDFELCGGSNAGVNIAGSGFQYGSDGCLSGTLTLDRTIYFGRLWHTNTDDSTNIGVKDRSNPVGPCRGGTCRF